MKTLLSKKMITKLTLELQALGYGILIFLIIADETLDIPHNVFGAPATPINWIEAILESSYLVLIASFSLVSTYLFIKRIKFLEGFISICAGCKGIMEKGECISLEQYMAEHSEAQLSHGLCPKCAEKYFGESP